MMILEQINGNLFGVLPEPFWMLIFGVGLIVLTIVLRRIFNPGKRLVKNEFPVKLQSAQSEVLKEKLS